MVAQTGERVGAVLRAEEFVVEFLGYGVYVGDEVPPEEKDRGRSIAGILAEVQCPSPKLVLDNGAVVWGCECWWAPEAQIEKRLHKWREQGWEIRNISIKEARERDG